LAYVCFHHVVDKDATVNGLADLPVGWCAWRKGVSTPWIREVSADDADET
jgi:predicted phosphoadenosine phosphosulfate sulfurtransferase